MRLPDVDAHYSHRVRCGRYVGRRLRQAKLLTLAADVEVATAEVLLSGRALEDAAGPVQDARADRDAADDSLDDIAQDGRAKIAGRSADANQCAPYTSIFHEGIEYFVAAPINQERARYTELAKRFDTYLDETDEVRVSVVPALKAGIKTFGAASEAVEQALANQALASTRLDIAEDDWAKLLTKVYGVLLGEFGKKGAERFFPKVRGKTEDASE
jgi:hypothetical protein